MRVAALIYCILSVCVLSAQGFKCDESMYLVVYTQSEGISTLYKMTEENNNFDIEPIQLSQNRRLSSLAYNVLDEHLYALDFDTYEMVKIDRTGKVTSLGVPANLDQNYIYHSGTISPDGSGIYLIGYDPEFQFDNRFYTINLSRPNFYAGFLGVTGERKVEVHDFATDPISGIMYGYDNIEGTLIQIAIGGQMSSLTYPTTGVNTMNGLFFNTDGDLFGYSAQRGIFAIDKMTGEIEFLEKGPEGTHADACSCPFTSSFEKEVSPREILPCSEFEVKYTFQNQLGIGQTWLKLRDTFPEGFEILSIESDIISDVNIVPSPSNILSLENFIYLMRENTITVRVRASDNFYGPFSSQATQWDFPLAFGTYQYSDDPLTEEEEDPTDAAVVGVNELDFGQNLEYNCLGNAVTLTAPINAESYLWNTGEETSSITVNEPGWYSLFAEDQCNLFFDSVFVSSFPGEKEASIIGDPEVILGQSTELEVFLNRGTPQMFEWTVEGQVNSCMDCNTLEVTPTESTTVELLITDTEGCETLAFFDIQVEIIRYFYAANAFSPNQDGVNDRFYLQSSTAGIIKELSIFNRWGNEIYKGQDLPLNREDVGWDGFIGNRLATSGVYIWVADIEYFDGFTETKSGPVTVFAQR